MARIRPPAQELGRQYESRGQQAAPMIPRPLQVGASKQQNPTGTRQAGPPQMATRAAQPQMAAPTYAQVAQGPPRQALLHSAEEIQHRQEITHDKRAAETPQAAGSSQAAPRAQAAPMSMRDLQTVPETAGMSHLPDDLHRYVSLLVRQYVDKRTGPMATDEPTTNSPVLDTDMLEEDRLAWQQLAMGMRRTPDGDHPMLGDNDDVTGDD